MNQAETHCLHETSEILLHLYQILSTERESSSIKCSLASVWARIISTPYLKLPDTQQTLLFKSSHLIMDNTPSTLQLLLIFGIISCIGDTKDGTYCNNPISKANLHEANNILDAIRSGADTTYIARKIPELAALCLCKRRHQDQTANFVQFWKLEDVARPSRPRGLPFRTHARKTGDVDQVFREMDSMDAMLDDHDREIREMAQRFKETISFCGEA